jgi:D-2-hydroxyacid dehydrogenase (NADP+)
VLVVSGLWHNDLLDIASKLRFIQSISTGADQFDRKRVARAGIRLASAQGANERAVAEHAMALALALSRQLHLARDNQTNRHWRPMIGNPSRREDELEGKTLVIVSLGRIGTRLAGLARAFGMSVIGVRRHPAPSSFADKVIGMSGLREALGRADIVALTCPLTPETEGLFGETLPAALPSSAWLINVARGRVVDEAALIEALRQGRLA